jgi:TRAP-type C4-dicarboxylate transport system permease large subunit
MAAGVVAISGTLAMLIPPSVALVIYGLLAEVNIGALLIGGVIPGILVTITIMATVWFLAWQDPSRAPSAPAVSLMEKFRMLRVVGPMLLLFGMVTGVIYTGVATPTEASALGAFGAFVLAFWKGAELPGIFDTECQGSLAFYKISHNGGILETREFGPNQAGCRPRPPGFASPGSA